MNDRGDKEFPQPSDGDSRSLPVESLTERAIRNQLRSEALQHPTTIIPLAVAGLSLIHLMGISPFPISPIWAVVSLAVSGVTAAGSFLWRYSVRYTQEYARRVREIITLQEHNRRRSEEEGIKQTLEALHNGFSSIRSDQGLKAFDQLNHEYQELQLAIDASQDVDSLSLSHIPSLSAETYKQGLSVLGDSLQLVRTIHSSNRPRLEAEIEQLEEEIESLKGDDTQAERVAIRRETIASHRELLALVDKQQLRVDQLFYQSNRCEASLAKTRIELAALKAGSSESSVDVVTKTLQQTINGAKEVQEELKRLGF